jgi:hypothetical protein
MTYGVLTEVSGPVEMYDAVHSEINRAVGSSIDGLLTHVGWVTPGGFRVLEVWESKEHLDRFTETVVNPILASFGARPPDGASEVGAAGEGTAEAGAAGEESGPSPQVAEVLDVRGLVLPHGGIVQ